MFFVVVFVSFIVESRTHVYKEMASSSPAAREYYSAALAPLQIEFVSGVPTKVKTLIRLIKYWRKTEFQVTLF